MPDWYEMLVPAESLLELFLRGTVMYLALFLMLRFVLHRQAGGISITDMLLTVLIADAAQNAMSVDYRSLPEGLLLVATLVFWNYALDWLSFRYPWLQHLTHPGPLELVHEGRILRRNLERELITEEDLLTQIRKQGVDDLLQVEKAYLEGDGHISVIKKEENGSAPPPAPTRRGRKKK